MKTRNSYFIIIKTILRKINKRPERDIFLVILFCCYLNCKDLSAAPPAITDLTATSGSQITLIWTAPDNGFGSACGSYLVRYSTSEDIVNDTEFMNAATYYQSWTPLAPSITETKTITGLIPDTTYWFSIKSSSDTIYSAISSTGTNYAIAGAFYLAWSSAETDNTLSICLGDYDNDGDLDQIAGNYGQPNRIYRNDGNGLFVPVWNSVETENTYTGIWNDYDNDGDLDHFAGNYSAYSRMYRNDGNGNFTNVIQNIMWHTLVADIGDYDNDGDLDIISNYYLYRNDSNNTFSLIWSPSEYN